MTEINIHEFKCDSCGKEIVRGEGDAGYQCLSVNNTSRGKYANVANEGNRKFHCSKLCIVNRCKRFKTGELTQCPIINSAIPLSSMMCKSLCDKCHLAKSGACPEECRFSWNALDDISECIGCKYSECTPKPHILDFDQDWIADCPNCNNGKLRLKEPRTFASFIKALYEFKADNGEGFCDRFEKEDMKTDDIRKVLENDNM